MSVDLTAGTVRVLSPRGTTAGTGFIVTDDGFIATTCAHVVQGAGAGPGDTVRVAQLGRKSVAPYRAKIDRSARPR